MFFAIRCTNIISRTEKLECTINSIVTFNKNAKVVQNRKHSCGVLGINIQVSYSLPWLKIRGGYKASGEDYKEQMQLKTTSTEHLKPSEFLSLKWFFSCCQFMVIHYEEPASNANVTRSQRKLNKVTNS